MPFFIFFLSTLTISENLYSSNCIYSLSQKIIFKLKGVDINKELHTTIDPLRLDKFIQAGADVNNPDENKYTPLHNSILSRNLIGSEILINSGADLNALGDQKHTPLHLAVAVELENESFPSIELLVMKGAELNMLDEEGLTPLHLSVLKYNFGITKYLIKSGANVNVEDKNQHTPLHFATSGVINKGDIEIAKLLVKSGAKLELSRGKPITPFHFAIRSGLVEFVRFVLRSKLYSYYREEIITDQEIAEINDFLIYFAEQISQHKIAGLLKAHLYVSD